MKSIKAVRYLSVSLIIISVMLIYSCSDPVTNSPYTRQAYETKVWDYSDNHHFLDTVYKASFVDYFLPGYTIDPENGWIIFPSLKPFVDKFENYNAGGVTIDSVYRYPELYSDLKANAKTLPNATNYIFTGFIKD